MFGAYFRNCISSIKSYCAVIETKRSLLPCISFVGRNDGALRCLPCPCGLCIHSAQQSALLHSLLFLLYCLLFSPLLFLLYLLPPLFPHFPLFLPLYLLHVPLFLHFHFNSKYNISIFDNKHTIASCYNLSICIESLVIGRYPLFKQETYTEWKKNNMPFSNKLRRTMSK